MATTTLNPESPIRLNEDVFDTFLPIALDIFHERMLDPSNAETKACLHYHRLTSTLLRVSRRAFKQVQLKLYDHERIAWVRQREYQKLIVNAYEERRALSEQRCPVPDIMKKEITYYEDLRRCASTGWVIPYRINRGLNDVRFESGGKPHVGSWVHTVGSEIQKDDADEHEDFPMIPLD